jgi:hypothetical protein
MITSYLIGPHLDPLENVEDLGTVWVLWDPHHLTVWSSDQHEWINLLFDCVTPDEIAERSWKPIPLATLQEAEQYFLKRTGYHRRVAVSLHRVLHIGADAPPVPIRHRPACPRH